MLQNERFKFFEPNGKQEELLKRIGTSPDVLAVFSAANGVGKSALAANIIGNLIWPGLNKYFDFPLFKEWKYPKRVRFITDPKLVEEIGPFHVEVEKWWPRNKYRAIKSGKQFYSQYKSGEWIVDVMTYDQEVRQFEGGTLGLIMFDEPPPRSIYHACVSRLRMGGLMLVLMTPLTEAAWFYDEVVPRHPESIVYASMEDNCKIHGIRGQLEHSQIQKMIAEMDPDEVEARAHGRAMYLRGLIYKSFDPKVHVANKPIDVPVNADVWQIIDPAGLGKPFAVGYGFPDSDGTLYQFAEWPTEDFYKMSEPNMGVKEYVDMFKRMEYGWKMKRRILDRHFGSARNLYTKNTLFEEFERFGFHYEPSYTVGQDEEEIETGIIQVRGYLKYDETKPLDALNRPKYVVSPTCKNTIKAFQRWSRDPKTQKPKEDYKDFMDVVRYWTMANPRISVSPPPPNYRKMFA